MRRISIIGILVMTMIMVSFSSLAGDGVLVSHPQFLQKLGCENELKTSICFNRAVKYSHPEAYFFEFTVNFDLDKSKVTEAIELSMEQVSTMLNPLTSKFYQFDSPLIELIDQTKYSAQDMIVAFRTHNRGDVYSSYFVPLVRDGDIVLFSGTYMGDEDIYQRLKNQCNTHSNEAAPYQYNGSTCILHSN
nr:hypothetical protein [uncultured Vibrio sp.]